MEWKRYIDSELGKQLRVIDPERSSEMVDITCINVIINYLTTNHFALRWQATRKVDM